MTKNVSASEVLEQHGVKINLKGVKDKRVKYKELAADLYAQMGIQEHRIAAIASSLNAALSNYQAASQGLKQLAAAQAALAEQVKGLSANGDETMESTDTSGE